MPDYIAISTYDVTAWLLSQLGGTRAKLLLVRTQYHYNYYYFWLVVDYYCSAIFYIDSHGGLHWTDNREQAARQRSRVVCIIIEIKFIFLFGFGSEFRSNLLNLLPLLQLLLYRGQFRFVSPPIII